MSDEALLAALAAGERSNNHRGACQVCDSLETMSERAREAVERALSGTIGTRRLAEILTRSGYPVGRRAVVWHQSGHTKHMP